MNPLFSWDKNKDQLDLSSLEPILIELDHPDKLEAFRQRLPGTWFAIENYKAIQNHPSGLEFFQVENNWLFSDSPYKLLEKILDEFELVNEVEEFLDFSNQPQKNKVWIAKGLWTEIDGPDYWYGQGNYSEVQARADFWVYQYRKFFHEKLGDNHDLSIWSYTDFKILDQYLIDWREEGGGNGFSLN